MSGRKVNIPLYRLSKGLTVKDVRAALDCTLAELDRWADDGRLPPDGRRHMKISKSMWVRAWLPEKVEAAKARVAKWREMDREARP